MMSPSATLDAENAIVVLEDDQGVTDAVRRGLEQFGYQVFGVSSRQEALALAKERGIRKFVLDIEIRDKPEGLGVLEDIKDLDPTAEAYIYSNHVESELYFRQAKRLHADLILEKDNLQSDVLTIVAEMLRRQKRRLEQIPQEGGVDPNIALYNRLVNDAAWYKEHLGRVVGIVNGMLICSHNDFWSVLAELRRAYPLDNKFVKRVDAGEEAVDIPTPLEIDDDEEC